MLVLPPLAWIILAAARAATAPGPALLDPVSLPLLGRSVLLAALAAGLALLLGLPCGWLYARRRMPGAPAWRALSLLPLLLPPYAAALAWSLLLGAEGPLNRLLAGCGWGPVLAYRSLPVAVLVLGFAYWPIAAWLVWWGARSQPRELEEAAREHLEAEAAARWSARPALLRAAATSGLLVFLLALADFGVPSALGLPTYPVEIVTRFQLDRDAAVTARLALPLLALVLPLAALQARLLATLPLAPAGAGAPLLPGAAGGWPAAALCLAVPALTAGVPLGTLAAAAWPPATYGDVWAESADHFGNTLLTAGGGALLAAAAAMLWAWAARRRRYPVLDLALSVSYALPASLFGVAFIRLLNRPGPAGWLYTSPGALVWCYSALFFPFAHRAVQAGWARVSRELLDEGEVLGAGFAPQFRAAVWPVLRPYALTGTALVALLGARELDATGLLRIPGGDTIAFRIHDYLHFSPGPNVAALCVLLVALSGAVAGAVAWSVRAPQDGEY